MEILSIGNSFSQDAQRYLHQIAKSDDVDINCFNLYIGGCSLSHHYKNMIADNKGYNLEMNGISTNFFVTLKEALLNRNWDIITIQQVSYESPFYEKYQPYLDELVNFVRYCSPKSKVVIHQTWAYEDGNMRMTNELGFKSYKDMLKEIIKSYKEAAINIKADFIIPSGEIMGELVENNIKKVYRDTLHASYGIGRYTLGLLWYTILTGNSVKDNKFCEFDEVISTDEIEIAKKSVIKIAENYRI